MNINKINRAEPSMTFGYWRPWNEESDYWNSYFDYIKEKSIAEYTAKAIGAFISDASRKNIEGLEGIKNKLDAGIGLITDELKVVNHNLVFINKKFDILIEHQRVTNDLLRDIASLLKIPDSEKERSRSIDLGIKFLINAKKDNDLYEDALAEFLKAESLMSQDYFVLHRIGCIYLYSQKHIDPVKAREYFLKAGKYALVDSGDHVFHLSLALETKFIPNYTDEVDGFDPSAKYISSESFEKAAFCSYILGQFDCAVEYQKKAVQLNPNPQNKFLLSKYLVRNDDSKLALSFLDKAIEQDPELFEAAEMDLDFLMNTNIVLYLKERIQNLDISFDRLLNDYRGINPNAEFNPKDLYRSDGRYVERLIVYSNNHVGLYKNEIKRANYYISLLSNRLFITMDLNERAQIICELNDGINGPVDKLKRITDGYETRIKDDIVCVGSSYKGGKVFYLDNTFMHGLICADHIIGESVWGHQDRLIGATHETLMMGEKNTSLIQKTGRNEVEKTKGLLSYFLSGAREKSLNEKDVDNVATYLLKEEQAKYKDWCIPTLSELKQAVKVLKRGKEGGVYRLWSSTEASSTHAWCLSVEISMSGSIKKCVEKRDGKMCVNSILPINSF